MGILASCPYEGKEKGGTKRFKATCASPLLCHTVCDGNNSGCCYMLKGVQGWNMGVYARVSANVKALNAGLLGYKG